VKEEACIGEIFKGGGVGGGGTGGKRKGICWGKNWVIRFSGGKRVRNRCKNKRGGERSTLRDRSL